MNGVNVPRKFLLESVSGEIMLQNQTNVNTRVILNDIIPRKSLDSQIAPTYCSWCSTIAWATSEQDEGTTSSNNTVIGSTPFQSS